MPREVSRKMSTNSEYAVITYAWPTSLLLEVEKKNARLDFAITCSRFLFLLFEGILFSMYSLYCFVYMYYVYRARIFVQ